MEASWPMVSDVPPALPSQGLEVTRTLGALVAWEVEVGSRGLQGVVKSDIEEAASWDKPDDKLAVEPNWWVSWPGGRQGHMAVSGQREHGHQALGVPTSEPCCCR